MKKEKKQFIISLIAGVLCGALIVGAVFLFTGLGDDSYEGSGFSEPEDAVIAYLEALRDCDPEEMRSTFAIETMIENYDVEAAWYHNGYPAQRYSSYDTILLPTDIAFGYDINVERRAAYLTEKIATPFALAANSAFDDMKSYIDELSVKDPIIASKEDEIEEVLDRYRRSEYERVLRSLEIVDIYEDPLGNEADSIEQEYLERLGEIYGAEDVREYVAELEVDGNDCLFGMIVMCYDGVWYNVMYGSASLRSQYILDGFTYAE